MRVLAIVMTLAMAGGLGVWMLRRRRRPASRFPLPASGSERLIAELAALDASFERHATVGGEARHVYEQERAQLKERIKRALDAETQRA